MGILDHPVNVVVYSLILAIVATILEVFSPYGFDNLTVPLGTSLLYYLLVIL